MPKGIHFDEAGNLAAIKINPDQTLTELYELLGTTVVSPLEIHSGLVLWIGADAQKQGQRFNPQLTALAASLGLAIDGQLAIHGPGVILGGTATRPDHLHPDHRLNIVLTTVRALTHTN